MKTLFDPPDTQSDREFDQWVHTPHGREVADKFIRSAWTLWSRGFENYGAKAIIEGIRWTMHLQNGPGEGEFKINNNYVSRLARFAEERAPKLRGFFRKRRLKDGS